jgi:5'-nucleotidase/UDP-sugar diphosphatase
MKNSIPLAALTLGLVALVGCAKKNNTAAQGPGLNGAVTDVDTSPMPLHAPEMTYGAPLDVTTPEAPAYEVPVVTQAPAFAAATAGTYTVKKGDTLFGIARQHYGNGGQWQRIANANPGLSPSTLKAGTTIAIP